MATDRSGRVREQKASRLTPINAGLITNVGPLGYHRGEPFWGCLLGSSHGDIPHTVRFAGLELRIEVCLEIWIWTS